MTTASAVGVQANKSGGVGYVFGAEHQLAQLAMTGCFTNTFYTDGVNQMDKVLELAKQCEPEFIAKLAVYARKKGMMKDMPCFLTAYLATLSPDLLKKVFPVVINNGKMLRNFVGLMRSGAIGRKSLGTTPQRLVQDWFNSRTETQVLRNSIGSDPSLADVIKLARPRPTSNGTVTKERVALYRYFIGKDFELSDLPEELQLYLDFKKDQAGWEKDLPGVPFEMLMGEPLTLSQWKLLAEQATWSQTRQALNTFLRHEVFKDAGMVKTIADKIRDEKEVKRSGVFPYQLLSTVKNIDPGIPQEIAKALEDAMEIATMNIPILQGSVYVCPDVSGSMSSSVTGSKLGKNGRPIPPSKVSCLDVGALMGASILRVNPHAEVIPFAEEVRSVKLDPKASVLENTAILRKVPGGGTACSMPMVHLNKRKAPIDTIIYVSDYESWADKEYNTGWGYGRPSDRVPALTIEWNKAKERSPNGKMICIDITPHEGSQAKDRSDTLNVGGFSDDVFTVMEHFVSGNGQHWVEQIQSTAL
jgi:60 kDa SS-A/Ro ribonucleoprotein